MGNVIRCSHDFDTADGIIWYNSFMKKSEAECAKDRFRLLRETCLLLEDQWLAPTPLWTKTWEISKALFQHPDKTLTYAEAKAVYDKY